jgi:hypothetical protein
MFNETFYFFLAITSSEGPQRTLPPEIKSVNFSTTSIGLVRKLKMGKELIKLSPERLALLITTSLKS